MDNIDKKAQRTESQQLRLLREALDKAETANRAKTDFFSRLSHDMRTPLNGILGIAELSQGEYDVTVLRDNIDKIKKSGEYLLSLVNDTLDLQKIESGKLVLEPETVRAQDILDNITGMFAGVAQEKDIEFRFVNVNVDMNCYIHMDPIRVKQIFINLLSNAVKFTPEGGIVELKIECEKRDALTTHEVITISDTGIGMSREFQQNSLFKPFAQENNERTSQYRGTGLGLSIVKNLVELMGGRIELNSEVGEGTQFKVYLNFELADDVEISSRERMEQTEGTGTVDILRHRNILVAEDHPLNAEIAKRLLENVDCNVTIAENGQKCLDTFGDSEIGEYAAILMDIRMPVMDGLTAARAIRNLNREDAGNIPIIAMTANAFDEDARAAIEAGMNAHLGKPIDTGMMYDILERLIAQ